MSDNATVYQLFNKDDELLYVGVTQSLKERMINHKNTQMWWAEVDHQTTEVWPTRKEAGAREYELICQHHPKYTLPHASSVLGDYKGRRQPTDPDEEIKRLLLRLPRDLYAQLRAHAYASNTSITLLIVECLRERYQSSP